LHPPEMDHPVVDRALHPLKGGWEGRGMDLG
jgi:hypothetical protein